MPNIQFHLFIQSRNPKKKKKPLKIQSLFSKKTLFSCKIVSPTIICQILVTFKIYVVQYFQKTYKLDLSFAQFKIL